MSKIQRLSRWAAYGAGKRLPPVEKMEDLVEGRPSENIELIKRRFWSNVSIGGLDECWEWNGHRVRDYGTFMILYRNHQSHRLAFLFARGTINPDLFVMHSCDNPPCCNPLHLSMGTSRDNVMDCVAKRRHAFGERQGGAKLTERLVKEMRESYAVNPQNFETLGDMFGVGRRMASRVIHRKFWRHI